MNALLLNRPPTTSDAEADPPGMTGKACQRSGSDLRRRIYLKAKADQKWRFWGLYVHVCKPETLREAYEMARRNGGAAGIDGVTFAAIEEAGLEAFLDDIHDELHSRTYRPSANRQVEIPKDGGVRIPCVP